MSQPDIGVPPGLFGPPYSPVILNLTQTTNMSGNSLTEALILLSSAYLSLVQPSPGPPKVGLFTIFPQTMGSFIRELESFGGSQQHATLMKYPRVASSFKIASSLSRSEYTPKELLEILCDGLFPQNTITVFYVNNAEALRKYEKATAEYLPQIIASLGLPIISYDTEFSFNSRPPLSIQLAPTMGQMMDVLFAFLKNYNWTDFSFLCTLSKGCLDEIASIRNKVEESHRRPVTTIYGSEVFSFNLLSYVNFTNGRDREEVKDKLQNELDRDTRVILVHGQGAEVMEILDVAKQMNLTGEEYVWIFTKACISLTTEKARVSKSYPLGSFVIGFDSGRKDMGPVAETAIDIWLQGLNSLATSPERDEVDFETGFTCTVQESQQMDSNHTHQGPTMKWKYGKLLYSHLLKAKLEGDIEFDEYGILKGNRFWIKNIQVDSVGSYLSSRTRDRGGASSSRSRLHSTRNKMEDGSTRRNRLSGISSGRDRTQSIPRGRTRPSGISRPNGRRRVLPSRTSDPSQGRRRIPLPLRSRNQSSSSRKSTFSDDEKERRPDIDMDTIGNSHIGIYSKQPTNESKSPSTHDRIWNGGYKYGGRQGRSPRAITGTRHIAKKIAEWDGRKLSVTSITWPGGASKPPKGKPEKYVLNVVTWKEDPHVIYVDPDNTTGECDSHSLPCTVYVRDHNQFGVGKTSKRVCCTGLCMDLLKRLSEELNIDVNLYETLDGSYGSPINDNLTQWSGLMGVLTRNEADLAMAALSITPERSTAVEFSMPFLQTGITIIVAIRAGVISPTAFLEPYNVLSWILILVFSVHATGTSIFIFEWLSPFGLNGGKTPLSVHKFSLCRSFWLIWAMLFGASVSTDMPRGCASRFLALIWSLFALVFCASYTANLAAFMITKDDFYDLSGIQDWRLKNPHHRHPPFKFGTIVNSSTDTNVKHNYPKIHTFMKEFPQYDVKAAIYNLKNQDIQAFIYDSTTLEYEVGKDSGCKLKTVGKRIAETGYGVAFPKKSPWRKKFNVALLQLQEDGEIERIQKFWLAGACHKKKEGMGVSSHELGILNFTSAFILIGGGIIMGALLLSLEHVYFRFGRKQLRKWDRYGCCSLVSLSMGQSLTFERSVMEAIDFHRQHKCKDPICETQLWKVKHELDIALLKIAQLRKQISFSTSGQLKDEIRQSLAISEGSPCSDVHSDTPTVPRRRRQNKTDKDLHDTTNQPFLLANKDASDDDDDDGYNIIDNPKPVPKDVATPLPPNYFDPYTIPKEFTPWLPQDTQQANNPEQTSKLRSLGPGSAYHQPPTNESLLDSLPQLPTPDGEPPSFEEVLSFAAPSDFVDQPRSLPSPPLPPPPTPPPIDFEYPSVDYPSSHLCPESPNEYERSKTPALPSDPSLYEPVNLNRNGFTSPSSPSTSSQTSTNIAPESLGGISKLSNEGVSSSPGTVSYFGDNFGNDNVKTLPQSSDRPLNSTSSTSDNLTNPFSLNHSKKLDSRQSSNVDKNGKDDQRRNGGVNMSLLQQTDNDVTLSPERRTEENVYINLDDAGGKETTF